MKLQEHHKEFAVKCFAKYMQRSDVADAFMLEFEHDLPKPPPPPEPPNFEKEIAGTEYSKLSRLTISKNGKTPVKSHIIPKIDTNDDNNFKTPISTIFLDIERY